MHHGGKRGLIIGKFMPPHKGHLYLVERALQQVDELAIVVCSLAREPIPGELRFRWMQELCPRAEVRHLTLELPQEPSEHPDFWDLWRDALEAMAPGKIDLVFTSETYGDRLAQERGARHVQVDLGRQTVPVSATMIRQNPMACWEYLPECVRPYFVRRVVILGSESTGKTTLAANLARHFGTVWAPEFAREYLEGLGRQCLPEDIDPIARGQVELEERLARQANRLLVCDTDLITTHFWSTHYFGTCPDWIRDASYERRADLYLLPAPDVPWVADLLRDRPHMRREIHEAFRAALAERGLPFTELSGTWDQRFAAAVRAIEPLLHQ